MAGEFTVEVTDNTLAHRFEARADGRPAGFVEYKIRDGQIALVHTQVEEDFEGTGIASRLVKDSLAMVRDSGLALLPVCSFVAGYVKKHPEYQDLVPASRRARYGLPEAVDPA